jgi:sugar/nucleoside kinase (ribokinase family)
VDQILRIVDQRRSDGTATYITRIPHLAERVRGAAGKSTKFELSVEQVKLGGNGVIMANALAQFGLPLTCVGNLGDPEVHPVFRPMRSRCELLSVAEASYTDALEFDDGKIMLSRQESAGEVTWATMVRVLGKKRIFQLFDKADFVALNNWTALPHMSDIWRRLQREICPGLSAQRGVARRRIFFDLADPEFRMADEIHEAMELIARFQQWFDAALGLNQKEADAVCAVLKLRVKGKDREFVRRSAEAIRARLGVESVVVHALAYAAAASKEASALVDGPFVEKPLISTGAGDHFNAGYGLGAILGGDLEQRLQLGVATSGYYVRTGKSPSIADLRRVLKKIG